LTTLAKAINGHAMPLSIGAVVGIIMGLLTFAGMVWAEGQRVGGIEQRIEANQARIERNQNISMLRPRSPEASPSARPASKPKST